MSRNKPTIPFDQNNKRLAVKVKQPTRNTGVPKSHHQGVKLPANSGAGQLAKNPPISFTFFFHNK
jgi:hypothetical protein